MFSHRNDGAAQLLIQAGANVNVANRDGQSVLLVAIQSYWEGKRLDLGQLIELLLEHGANIEHKDSLGRTALSRAIDLGKLEIIELLLEKGADVNSTDNRGTSPPWRAVDQRVDTAVAELLITHGADINHKDKRGTTPLELACSKWGNPKTAQLLREKGASMD